MPKVVELPLSEKAFTLSLDGFGFAENALCSSLCRESFNYFVKEFWKEVPGAGEECIWSWHLDVFCEELQKVAERVFTNTPKEYDVICNVSPGTSKSTIWSILFPCWCWTRMPSCRVLSASHTDDLVLDLANKARSVIKGEKYHALFPEIELRADQDTKGYYANTKGGDRYTCTVAGKSPMGFHAHIVLVDDPIDPKKAVSQVELKAARDFMTQIIPSRRVNKRVTVTCLIMQRLDREDPTAVMLETSRKEGAAPVRHICLPAKLTDDVRPVELAGRYVNALMDPVRLDEKALAEAHANLGDWGFAGQFLQSPKPLGGGMFHTEYFNSRVQAGPYAARRVRYWDRASTEMGGCYTAGVLLSRVDGVFHIEHVEHGQWEPDTRNAKMRACALRDRSKYGPKNEPIIWIEDEGGSSGKDSAKSIARYLAGFPVFFDRPTGSKDTRAEVWASQCAVGNVKVVDDGTWDVAGYVTEHEYFRPDPMKSAKRGKYKDRVDSSSGACIKLLGDRDGPALRSFSLRKVAAKLKLVVCDLAGLANTLIDDHRCILLYLRDPLKEVMSTGASQVEPCSVGEGAQVPKNEAAPAPPPHALSKLLDHLSMDFLDIDPSKLQENWRDNYAAYDRPPSDLIITREQGKRLWFWLLKHRDPKPEVLVIVDESKTRGFTVAYAITDSLHLPRSVIHSVADPDDTCESPPSNQHVYDMIKTMRMSVVV